jgi:hypothetical protein
MESITDKVDRLNELHQEIQKYKAEHPEEKLGYWQNTPGSILNAYREGDLSFDEAVEVLNLIGVKNAVEQINRALSAEYSAMTGEPGAVTITLTNMQVR